MQACARGRYGNEFGHACLGKPRLIGMSLVPVTTSLQRPWHIACTLKSGERGAQTMRQAASAAPLWRARFLRRETVLPAHNKGPSHNIHREGCLDDLVWRILSTWGNILRVC
jgi:hypothetical protein